MRRRLPLARAECIGGPRPCPHRSCVYHLGTTPTGASCTLDEADRDGMPLEDVAAVLGVSRERVQQIERRALARLAELQRTHDARELGAEVADIRDRRESRSMWGASAVEEAEDAAVEVPAPAVVAR